MAEKTGKQLREKPTYGKDIDKAEAEFTAAIIQTAELVIRLKEHKRRRKNAAEISKLNRSS